MDNGATVSLNRAGIVGGCVVRGTRPRSWARFRTVRRAGSGRLVRVVRGRTFGGASIRRYALARARFTMSATVFLLMPTSRAIHR